MNEVVMKFISVSKYATRNSQNNENLSLASIFRADSGNETGLNELNGHWTFRPIAISAHVNFGP